MPGRAGGSVWDFRASILRLGLLAWGSLGMFTAVLAGDSRPSNVSSKQTDAAEQKQAGLAELRKIAKEAGGLRDAGKLSEAITAGQRAVVLARQQYGDDSKTVASWQEWLATIQERLEQWEAAQKSRADVLAIRSKIYGKDDWHTTDARLALEQTIRLSKMTPVERERVAKAAASNHQVHLLIGQKKFADARPVAEEALESRKKLFGDSHPDMATSLQNLAFVYGKMGNDIEAERLYQHAIEIMTKVGARMHPSTATILENLGVLYRARRDYSKAEPRLRESLDIRTKTLGPNDRDTISSLDALITLYDRMRGDTSLEDLSTAEKLTEAIAIGEKAVEIARRRAETSEAVADGCDWLGQLYEKRQDWAAARNVREKALSIQEKLHADGDWRATDARMALEQTLRLAQMAPEDREHLLKANTLNARAIELINRGRYAEALPLATESLATREKLLGESHCDTAVSVHNLAFTHWKLGSDAKAEALFQRALATLKTSIGDRHPSSARVAECLGLLYQARREYAKAEFLLRQALDARRQDFGEKHRLTVRTLDEVASLYESMKSGMTARDFRSPERAAQAIALAEKAMLLANQRFGESSEAVAQWQEWLAQLHEDREEWDAAKKARQTVLSIRLRLHGARHWSTRLAQNALEQSVPMSQMTATDRALLAKAAILNHQVMALVDKGSIADALPSAKEALEIRTKSWGPSHPDTTTSLNTLAYVYWKLGKTAEAVPLFQQAIDGSRKALGEENPSLATYLDNLGLLYRNKNDYAKAEPLLRQAIEIRKKVLGPKHADTVQSLYDLGRLYKLAKDYAKAEPLYREALEVRKKVLGDQHRDTATSLDEMGGLYDTMRDYAKAEPLYQQALDIRKKVLGSENVLTVSSLRRLGLLDQARREYAKAEPLLHEALETRKKMLGPESPRYADSVFDLASLYDAQGAYARAEPLYREALAIRKKVLGETHLDYAATLNTLGILYVAQGDYRQAEPLLGQALAIRKKIFGEMSAEYALTLNYLADLYRLQSDYSRAESLYRQALAIRKKVLGEADASYGQSLNNLAVLYVTQAKYDRAEPLLREYQEICRKVLGEAHPSYSSALNNLAIVYEGLGDDARAETLLRQAAEIAKKASGEAHPSYALELSNLASLYKSQKDYTRAEKLYQQALDIDKKALGELHPQYASILNSLAGIYESRGAYDRAEPLLREAVGIRRNALGEAHPDYALSLTNLAGLHFAQGEYAEAERWYREALAVRKKALGDANIVYADSLNDLARLYRSQGEEARAEPMYRQALEIYEGHFGRTVSGLSERQQLLLAKSLRWQLDGYLSVTETAHAGAVDVYRHVLGWKGAVYLRQYASRAAHDRPELKPLFDNLAAISIRLSNLALRIPDAKGRDEWERQISLLSEQKETIERDLGKKSAEFRQQQALLNMTPDELQKRLATKTALLDFLEYSSRVPQPQKPGQWRTERRLVVFIVRCDRPIVRIDLGAVKPLEDATESWRREILHDAGVSEEASANQTASDQKPPQQLLVEAIWRPLQKSLDGVETVLVSPDGVLNQVPLAALPGKSPGTYLVEELKLAVVPVPRLISTLFDEAQDAKREQTASRASGDNDSLLIVGDVSYGARPGKPDGVLVGSRSAVRGNRTGSLLFPALEFSRSEMVTIRDTFEERFPDAKVRTLRGDRATEDAFRREAPQCRWMHLATHGFFAPPDLKSALAATKADKDNDRGVQFGRQGISDFNPGLLSGLALSGANVPANADEDDGILTAVEVAGLDLHGVDLVVLSACETGLGKVAGGEGVLGLQRAFQLSGAKTAVTSLWKIPDRSTSQLMQRFYENLWKRKLSKVDALREAQIWMLKEGRQRGLDIEDGSKKPTSRRLPPKYWAAFVLSGDWR